MQECTDAHNASKREFSKLESHMVGKYEEIQGMILKFNQVGEGRSGQLYGIWLEQDSMRGWQAHLLRFLLFRVSNQECSICYACR